MPEEYFLTLVGPRVAPATRPGASGLPLEDGHTLPFVVDRGWVGPAGTYIEQWSIRDGERILYRHPARYIEVRGFQSVRRFSDTVRVPVRLEPGIYDIIFVVEDYRMGSFAVEAGPLAEHAEAPPAAEPAAAPPAAATVPKPAPAAPPAPKPAAVAVAAPAAPAAAYTGEDPAAVRKRVYDEELAKGSDPRVAEARSKSAEIKAKKAMAAAATQAPAPPPAAAPAPSPPPAAPEPAPSTPAAAAPAVPAASGEDPAAVRKRVFDEELAKGSDPRVAEARAKSAEIKAKRAASAPPAPAAPAAAGPAAPPAASPAPSASSAAPAAADPLLPDAPPGGGGMTAADAASVRAMVLQEEVDRGTAPPVAEALAKAAEIRVQRGVWWRPDW